MSGETPSPFVLRKSYFACSYVCAGTRVAALLDLWGVRFRLSSARSSSVLLRVTVRTYAPASSAFQPQMRAAFSIRRTSALVK